MIHSHYAQFSLPEIIKRLTTKPAKIILTGQDLTLAQICAASRGIVPVKITNDAKTLKKIRVCYEKMIKDVECGIPIYGCNTGYGARASRVLTDGSAAERMALAKKISEGITHIDVSVGPEFDQTIVRSAILIRVNMLLNGVSAVKVSDLETYVSFLNYGLTPVVNQYGGLGASGDLAHNCRVLNAVRQIKGVKVRNAKGKIYDAKEIFKKFRIPPLELSPKAGLGLVNGDNFSTACAALLAIETAELLLISTVAGALMVEVLKGSDRSFHPILGAIRPHPGQVEAASIFRDLLSGSGLAYQEMVGHSIREKGVRVQDFYSLRCMAQFQGISFEDLKRVLDVVERNANSVSDNPVWVPNDYATAGEKPWQWVSGGNFLAMHMADSMDTLRRITTRIIKLNDRHLSKLVNPNENNGLPPNLSEEDAATHCAFKGIQVQSGMMEVYSQLLSIPITTMFGVHEEGNQDITSHALTSGILAKQNIELAQYSIAQNLLAIAQAVELRGGVKLMSEKTQPVYEFVRQKSKHVNSERPLNHEIEILKERIWKGELTTLILEQVFGT